eukprot:gene7982-9489_t
MSHYEDAVDQMQQAQEMTDMASEYSDWFDGHKNEIFDANWTFNRDDAVRLLNSTESLSDIFSASDVLKKLQRRFEFCVDDYKTEARQTFPWPLPIVRDKAYGVCERPDRLAMFLCRPDELMTYLHMLVANDYEPETSTTDFPKACEAGHFCRKGSVKPKSCPPRPLVYCDKGTENMTNFVGVGADFVTFIVCYILSKFFNVVAAAKRRRDRKKDESILQRQDTELLQFKRRPNHKRRDSVSTRLSRSCSVVALPSVLQDLFKGGGTGGAQYTQLSEWRQQESGVVGVPADDSESNSEDEKSDPEEGAAVVVGKLVQDQRFQVNLEFRELGLALKGSGARILHGVTGKFLSGRITAIMGPSGAGKTTFLATILDKATYGIPQGQILLNGYERSLKALKSVIGFVPQEDVMHRDLTVDENLWISANYRLPASLTRQEKLVYVERAVRVLGLDDIRHSCIGDEETRGISGGQRKRVNVGIELVIDPILLFCDEPTSGLDSTASKLVVRALRTVASTGVTVAVVLHQPSFEIFQMFDDILLLGKGGRTVYMGPEEEVYGYFEQIGFSMPERGGSPEYLLDVIAGLEQREGSSEIFDPAELFELWDEYYEAREAVIPSGSPAGPAGPDGGLSDGEPGSPPEPSTPRRRSSGDLGESRSPVELEETDLEAAGVEGAPMGARFRLLHGLKVWWGIFILVASTQLSGLWEDIYENTADVLWRPRLRTTPGLVRQTLSIFVRLVKK